MPRYIDADKFIEWLDAGHFRSANEVCLSENNVIKMIKSQPTADVVEVVRCEKCKHLTVHNSPTLYAYCERTHFKFEPFKTDTRTHFCSYGKRKG